MTIRFYVSDDGEIRAFESVRPHVLLHADGRVEQLWERPGAFVAGRGYRKLRLDPECEAGIRRLIAERDEARTLARKKHQEHRFYHNSMEPFPGWTAADLACDEREHPWLLDPDPNVPPMG